MLLEPTYKDKYWGLSKGTLMDGEFLGFDFVFGIKIAIIADFRFLTHFW